MSDTMIEERPALSVADEWAERIAALLRSGVSVKHFSRNRADRIFFLRLAQTPPAKGAGTFRFGG